MLADYVNGLTPAEFFLWGVGVGILIEMQANFVVSVFQYWRSTR